jgi:hypothetical protein
MAERPVVFIDPDVVRLPAFRADSDYRKTVINNVRKVLESYDPGSTESISDSRFAFALGSLRSQLSAIRDESSNTELCFIVGLKDSVGLQALMFDLSSKEALKQIPGGAYEWGLALGLHEGQHCNQMFPDKNTPDLHLRVMGMEADADHQALKWLEENGYEDVAKAFADYRALGSQGGSTHATSIFLSRDAEIEVTQLHWDAAEEFLGVMAEGVADELRITTRDAAKLLESDPEKFLGVVKAQLANGTYSGLENPHIAEYIHDYVGAYERRVIGAAPESTMAPENNTSSPPSFSGPR